MAAKPEAKPGPRRKSDATAEEFKGLKFSICHDNAVTNSPCDNAVTNSSGDNAVSNSADTNFQIEALALATQNSSISIFYTHDNKQKFPRRKSKPNKFAPTCILWRYANLQSEEPEGPEDEMRRPIRHHQIMKKLANDVLDIHNPTEETRAEKRKFIKGALAPKYIDVEKTEDGKMKVRILVNTVTHTTKKDRDNMYNAPELDDSSSLSKEDFKMSDIYALGIIFFQVATDKSPFWSSTGKGHTVLNRRRRNFSYLEAADMDELKRNMVKGMVQKDTKLRVNIQEVRAHPYFFKRKQNLDFLANFLEYLLKTDTSDDIRTEFNSYGHILCLEDWRETQTGLKQGKNMTEYPSTAVGLLQYLNDLIKSRRESLDQSDKNVDKYVRIYQEICKVSSLVFVHIYRHQKKLSAKFSDVHDEFIATKFPQETENYENSHPSAQSERIAVEGFLGGGYDGPKSGNLWFKEGDIIEDYKQNDPECKNIAIPEQKYEFLDHTADIQLHTWGESLKEAFEQTANCMYAYMTDDITQVLMTDSYEVTVQGDDLPSLLYHFLDELLFVFAAQPFLIGRNVKIHEMDETTFKIRASVYGQPFDLARHPAGTEIKAITYSAMQIYQRSDEHQLTQGNFEIYVIVDI